MLNHWKTKIASFEGKYIMMGIVIFGIMIAIILGQFGRNQSTEEKRTLSPRIDKERKGFALFDEATWIRGERELQILEKRAIKGQLEQEIAQFIKIQEASVLLDYAEESPKASVLLTLKPGVVLEPNDIQAIAVHMAGAIQKLEPEHISIMDTSGNLYRTEGVGWTSGAELRSAVQHYLTWMLGDDFYCMWKDCEGALYCHLIMDSASPHQETIHQGMAFLLGQEHSFKIETLPLHPSPPPPAPVHYPLFKILAGSAGVLLFIMNYIRSLKKRWSPRVLAKILTYTPPALTLHMLHAMEQKIVEEILPILSPERKEELLTYLKRIE